MFTPLLLWTLFEWVCASHQRSTLDHQLAVPLTAKIRNDTNHSSLRRKFYVKSPAVRASGQYHSSKLFATNVHDATEAVNIVGEDVDRIDGIVFDIQSISVYSAAFLLMTIFLIAMFYPLGINVILQTLLYVSSLAFVKLALKVVFAYNFKYPKFITAMHLCCSSFGAFLVLVLRKNTLGKQMMIPTKADMIFGIIPLSCAFGLSIVFENSALLYVSASFSEVIGAATPVLSALLTWLMDMPFPLQLLGPIGLVVIGCIISVQGEMQFSWIGLFLLLIAVFFRCFKGVMQQKLMTQETKDKFDPVTLMAWTCMFSFVVVAAYSTAVEGMLPHYAILESPDVFGLVSALMTSSLIACSLNISALFVVKQLGAVGMQMVGQAKAILVVIGGVALLSESFTEVQMIGFGMALLGVFLYSHVQRQYAARKQ